MANDIHAIAKKLVAKPKGILAADESMRTCDKRFTEVGIPTTEENRRDWRELLFTAPGVQDALSGVILFDETIRQKNAEGKLLRDILKEEGISIGIKVDEGTEPITPQSKELVTKGLEGLETRLREYVEMGAEFTKWRAVYEIGEGTPSKELIKENAERFATYSLLCQQAGLVPIVEPEVLLSGTHTLEQSAQVIEQVLKETFAVLKAKEVDLGGMILKSSMALPGKDSGIKTFPDKVAEATLRAFHASVPTEVPGIVFLSGGQSPKEATENLNAIAGRGPHPWEITFSYSRALQEPVLWAWKGIAENKMVAQGIFKERLEETVAAREGKYKG